MAERKKKTAKSARKRGLPPDSRTKERRVFQHSAVSLWEEDISVLRSTLMDLKSQGVSDLRNYLDAHSAFLSKAARMIKVVDVNDAALRLYEVKSKIELLGSLDKTLDLEDPVMIESMKRNVLAIWEGANLFEGESMAETPSGKKLTLAIKAYIPPENDPYPYMLVNVIDITEQKRLEKSQEQERALLMTVMDNLPDLIYLKDRESIFVLGNTAIAEFMGAMGPKNLAGKTDRDFYPKDMADKFLADERQIVETATGIVNVEEPAMTASGSLKWLLTTKVPLLDKEGSVTGIVGIGRDITKRKLAEAEAEEANRRLEFILGATRTGLDIIDANHNLRYVDPEWQKVYGDPKDRKCYEYFMGAKAVCPECGTMRAYTTRQTTVSEEVLPREGNRPVQVTTIPFQDENGEWLVAEVNVDITERKRAEEKNLRLAALVESAEDAIVGLGLDRIITSWNKGAERVYGYSAEEVIGRPTSLFIPPDLENEARGIRERINQGESINHFETLRRRKDGTLIDVSLTLSPIWDAEGRLIGHASIARDITEQKKIQAQLMRVQKLESLSTLAGGIAHRFNNINAVINGYLEVLAMEENLTESARTSLHAAQQGVQRAAEITDRLLVLTGSSQARREKIHLDELARSRVALLDKQFEAEGVIVRLDLRETAPIVAVSSQLGFMLTSLLTNALHSLIDSPLRVVTVRTGSVSGSAFLEVSDTGCGIAPENLTKLFTPFFTTKGEFATVGSTQGKVKGAGLSLAVCQAIVSEYGGRIDVESQPGTGSTFRVRFPIAAAGAG
jgi:PAS domain S-box-containing protein